MIKPIITKEYLLLNPAIAIQYFYKSRYFILPILAILLINCTTSKHNQKWAEIKEKKQIILFDGTSTNAWKGIKSDNFPEQGWKIMDNTLTVLGETDDHPSGHDIVTKEKFTNFELELEVLLSKGANSGIKYIVYDSFIGKEGSYLGLEYQLLDNENHLDALNGRNGNHKMASLYDILPAPKDININPPGEWNKIKILVEGNHVEHWLNDKKVIEFNRNSSSFKELVSLSKYNKLENFGSHIQGHILLQGHGNQVSFRAITISNW